MKRMLGFVAVCMLWATTAMAEPKTADEWYKEGENQYVLGEYDKAAEAFKKGFELESVDSKKPAFIYNVAQSYRQAKKCTEAVFFYKRFLQMKDSGMGKPLTAERRAETEQLITEADACAGNGGGPPKTNPTTVTTPTTTTPPKTNPTTTTTTTPPKTNPTTTTTTPTTTTPTVTTPPKSNPTTTVTTTPPPEHKQPETKVAVTTNNTEEDDENGTRRRWRAQEPKLIDGRATLGLSHIGAGETADVPLQGSFALIGGYPIKINDKLRVYPGGVFTFTPIPWKNRTLMNADETASMTQLLANGSATYEIMPKLYARGDLGMGLLFFGGFEDFGNPFTVNAQSTTGTMVMFNLRIAASADYDINKNLFVTATPFAFSYSPAKAGLIASSLTSINFSVGAGYRM
jgi:hypothetical protein